MGGGRRLALGALVAALVVPVSALAGGPVTGAGAATSNRSPVYLALGDSITFGYREPTTTPAPDYQNAASFVGYPQDVGAALGWNVVNAACPGETSASFMNVNAPSNGCEKEATGNTPGYRATFPLHVSYSGSQLAFAVSYLRSHSGTRLVSLMIGANDLLACRSTTADGCVSELSSVVAKVGTNIGTILKTIRGTARYGGQIIVVNYYSQTYAALGQPASLFQTAISLLNQTADRAAKPYRVSIADGFSAFANAAQWSAGDSCKAGLLTQLSTGGCGIHPSPAGQAVLAVTVASAVKH